MKYLYYYFLNGQLKDCSKLSLEIDIR